MAGGLVCSGGGSVGLGFVFWVGSLAALTWQYGFVIHNTYPMYTYISSGVESKACQP